MTETLGHFGMALLFLAPTWVFVSHKRIAAVVIATGFWFGPLLDVDTYLSTWFPSAFHHHGVVHTLSAVLLMTVILGSVLGRVFYRLFTSAERLPREAADEALWLGVIAVGSALCSHIAADMLSAPDIASQIEPLWPVVQGPVIAIDVLYYDSVWATVGLFMIGLISNCVFFYLRTQQGLLIGSTADQ